MTEKTITADYVDDAVRNAALEKADVLNMPNVTYIAKLKKIGAQHFKAEKLEWIGDLFLADNDFIDGEILSIDFPRLRTVADRCFLSGLEKANLPSLQYAGVDFLHSADGLKSLDLPLIEVLNYRFMERGYKLEKFNAPRVVQIYDDVLSFNTELQEVTFPSLIKIGDNFLRDNKKLTSFKAPRLVSAGKNCHPLVYEEIRKNQSKLADFLIQTNALKHFGA